MTFTEDDEDQIMFDLYDGLDTFEQPKPADNTEKKEVPDTPEPIEIPQPSETVTEVPETTIDRFSDAEPLEEESPCEDDGLVFLVEDDDETDINPARVATSHRIIPKRKTGGWVSKYRKKERVIYVGAPNSDANAMASIEPNKESFCLVTGIPYWMDLNELNRIAEDTGGVVAFSRILSDPSNGLSVGVAIIEFVDKSGKDKFKTNKNQYNSTQLTDDIFNDIKESPLYRDGIFKRGLLERIMAHLGIPLRNTKPRSETSDLYHDIEYEVQQRDMIQNGDFDFSTKTFPWLNLNLVKFIGRDQRKDVPENESIYNIANHLEAYKAKQVYIQNRYNTMMQHYMQMMPKMVTPQEAKPSMKPQVKRPVDKELDTNINRHSERKHKRLAPIKEKEDKRRSSPGRDRKKHASKLPSRRDSRSRDDRRRR
ncbi:hypothetical protein BBOV_II005170 [Babesia bovis T2Bo]|uniref:RRM domain-containing protein n=1 Tax=Babesia bovis TaxID=5865 RepID=A7AU58_BABBO|nr:hypothetical protein BBOV_II005170 [Babesia bovis T2Bo]EDO06469.1 hypothetical protein BBOV_II005170 [Babesia bovis T2Bo]|eukprot:XP_001610037.1 hypothetical protein [Babesia bovis T2Bo]